MKIVLFVSIILLAVSSLFLWAAARKSVDYRTTAEESEVCELYDFRNSGSRTTMRKQIHIRPWRVWLLRLAFQCQLCGTGSRVGTARPSALR